ncbi:TylF/MycF family methyltransferase [Patescibacteria group bacterium]|nr:TylF/MycF family methyltransferase [Patescibacteria group bacterium]
MLIFVRSVFFLLPSIEGVLVEAGAYKGGSTAKLSLVAKITKRKLIVFDSFKGLPDNKEVQSYTNEINTHQNFKKNFFIFPKGKYKGSLGEVKKNVSKYGSIDVCTFKKGWFKNTLPRFNDKIAAMFLDVDLASSTRVCLKYLYPLLQPNGILMSHDGHLTLATKVYRDKKFWQNKVRAPKPPISDSIKGKIIFIVKPSKI